MSHEEEIELDDEVLGLAAGGIQGSKLQVDKIPVSDPVIAPMPSVPVVTNFSNHYLDAVG